jgi:hypothetical protein
MIGERHTITEVRTRGGAARRAAKEVAKFDALRHVNFISVATLGIDLAEISASRILKACKPPN